MLALYHNDLWEFAVEIVGVLHIDWFSNRVVAVSRSLANYILLIIVQSHNRKEIRSHLSAVLGFDEMEGARPCRVRSWA